jgi:hypothetical protein
MIHLLVFSEFRMQNGCAVLLEFLGPEVMTTTHLFPDRPGPAADGR